MSVTTQIVLVTFLALCVLEDVRSRRIPNRLAAAAMLGAMALATAHGGLPGLAASALGALIAGTVLFAPFALGGVGAGDVKMMAAVGAFVGPRLALASLLVGMMLGGLAAVLHLASRGRLVEKLLTTLAILRAAVATRSVAPLRLVSSDPGAVTLPYSLPLGLGTVLATLLCRGTEVP